MSSPAMISLIENTDNANDLNENLRYIRRTIDELKRSQRIEQRRGLCTQLYDALVVMFIADNSERFEPRKCLRLVQLDVVLPSIEFEGLLAVECSDAMSRLECGFIDDLSLSQLDEVASELKAHGESLYASLFHYCELRAGMASIEVMLLVKAKTLQQLAEAYADDKLGEYDKNYSFSLYVDKPDGFKANYIQWVKREMTSALPADNTDTKPLTEMSLPEHPEEAVYALCFKHIIYLMEQVDFIRLSDMTKF